MFDRRTMSQTPKSRAPLPVLTTTTVNGVRDVPWAAVLIYPPGSTSQERTAAYVLACVLTAQRQFVASEQRRAAPGESYRKRAPWFEPPGSHCSRSDVRTPTSRTPRSFTAAPPISWKPATAIRLADFEHELEACHGGSRWRVEPSARARPLPSPPRKERATR